MRLRNIPGADEAIADSPHCIQEPMAEKGRWNLIFGNDHPVHIEIGMGKGQFIMQLAKNTRISITSELSVILPYCSVLYRKWKLSLCQISAFYVWTLP